MSVRAMQAVWQHSQQSGGALVLLLAIADNAHDDGDSAYPSIGTLAKKARMTERNVNILLKQLEADGELSITRSDQPNRPNTYRVLLPGLADPEKISPEKSSGVKRFQGEKISGQREKSIRPDRPLQSVNSPLSDPEKISPLKRFHPEAGFTQTVNSPSKTTPRVNSSAEREGGAGGRTKPTLDTYQPDCSFLDGLATERPDLNLPAVIDNWRDYHRERGTAIKDFNASLRRWVRQEKPPPRASPNGQRESTAQARERRTLEAIWGKKHEPADIQSEPIEARYSVVSRADPGAD